MLGNAWCVLAWCVEQIPRPRLRRPTPEFWLYVGGAAVAGAIGLLVAWVTP